MPNTRKAFLLVLFLAFFAVQLSQTLFRKYWWPFTPYALFWWNRLQHVAVIDAVLYADDGSTQEVAIWHLMPFEYFITQELGWRGYVRSENVTRQQAFSSVVLKNLNSSPWIAFDEVPAPARPPHGHYFIGFDLVLHTYDLRNYPSERRLTPLRTVVVHRFRAGEAPGQR